jgi:hypothetical protein
MPSFIYNVTTPAGYLPFNVNALQTVTFSVIQPVEGTSYFTLETKANVNGGYDQNSQKSTSASFAYNPSNITNIVYDNYKMSAVVRKGVYELYYTPSVFISGSELIVRGVVDGFTTFPTPPPPGTIEVWGTAGFDVWGVTSTTDWG